MYTTLIDFVQEREPDYGRWTYEQITEEWTEAPEITARYQPIYDPPRQAEASMEFGRPRGTISRISSTLFYHHADSPDGGGRPYVVDSARTFGQEGGGIPREYVPDHWTVADIGSWIWNPRGWMDTQNPSRNPLARRLPASYSAGIPEVGAYE